MSRFAGPLAVFVLTFTASTVVVRAQSQIEIESWRLINSVSANSTSNFLNVTGQSLQLYRVPVSYRVRSTEDHRWGLKLTFPFSVGFHEIKVSDGFPEDIRESVGTLTLVPGVLFEVPVGPRWTLLPYAEFGAGMDLDSKKFAYIYSGGLNTVFSQPWKRYEFRVGPGLYFDGSTLSDGSLTSGYSTLELGFDLRRAFKKDLARRRSDISFYAIQRRFLNDLVFDRLDGVTVELTNETEFGVTLGIDRPFKLWLLKISRVGLGYKFGDRLSTVRILFGAPF